MTADCSTAKHWEVARKSCALRSSSRQDAANPNGMSHNRPAASYNRVMKRAFAGALLAAAIASPSLGQTPLPFPKASAPPAEPPRAASSAQAPASPATAATTQAPTSAESAANAAGSPARMGGFPIFPGSQLLGSYDAGKGQRYYLYGTTASYVDIVTFYKAELKDKGDEVFTAPPTHMFQQRFREDTMAFPPGVTVKDWTYQSRGYPNPRTGGQPERFPTVVMIVPPPPAAPPAR